MIATITQALQRGDTAAALSAAKAFVASDAQNPQAHHWLGLSLQRNGDLAAARAAIDQAIDMAPDRADFQISRAALALSQKDYQAAEQGMKDAVSLDPNQLQAYITLAHIALARSENEEASRQLKLAQRIDPDHPQVLLLEGHVAQYGGQAEKALKCFTAAAEIEPDNAFTQVSLGMAYGARGMWPFAEQALKNAMAIENGNPGVMRGLVRSQMQQDKWPEALDTLGQWLINKPGDHSVRMMRAQIRLQLRQAEPALEDLQMVNQANPANPQVLTGLMNVLASLGRRDEALEEMEKALVINPESNVLWSMRVTAASGHLADTQAVLARWLAALPDSPQAHETLAQVHENIGELDAAEAGADKALSLAQNSPHAQFIKLRAEMRKDPRLALARLEVLGKAATNRESERMVLAWRGLSYDKLQQYDKAAESFRQMVQRPLAQRGLPPIVPARPTQAAASSGTLLWAPSGTRMEIVLQALSPVLGARLLADRNMPNSRNDGFGHQRGLPDTPEAGTAQRWQQQILALGLEPETVVDWIPHFDGYTASELNGLRTIALISDPRDALINWMVFGSAQGYMFHPDDTVSAEWLALSCEAFADHLEKNPDAVSVVKVDDLPAQAASVSQALQSVLNLEQAPDTAILGVVVQARGGVDNQFAGGHWRRYRESFKAAFDRLTPVAVRLGYPEA